MKFRKTVTLLIAACTLQSTYTKADSTPCEKSLAICQKLVKDQENENFLLKQKIGVLTNQRDTAEKQLEKASQPALVPVWGWFVIGAVAGGAIYAAIRR